MITWMLFWYTIDELIEQVDSDYPEIMEDSGFDN